MMQPRMRHHVAPLAAARSKPARRFARRGALLALLLASSVGPGRAAEAGAHDAGAALHVSEAIAAPSLKGVPNGKGSFAIRNDGAVDDELVGMSSPIASEVQLHSMKNEGGVMKMREAGALPLPAGKNIDLHAADMHLMFMGLKKPLAAGDTFPLTLRFAKAPPQTLTMRVAAPAPMSSMPAMHGTGAAAGKGKSNQ